MTQPTITPLLEAFVPLPRYASTTLRQSQQTTLTTMLDTLSFRGLEAYDIDRLASRVLQHPDLTVLQAARATWARNHDHLRALDAHTAATSRRFDWHRTPDVPTQLLAHDPHPDVARFVMTACFVPGTTALDALSQIFNERDTIPTTATRIIHTLVLCPEIWRSKPRNRYACQDIMLHLMARPNSLAFATVTQLMEKMQDTQGFEDGLAGAYSGMRGLEALVFLRLHTTTSTILTLMRDVGPPSSTYDLNSAHAWLAAIQRLPTAEELRALLYAPPGLQTHHALDRAAHDRHTLSDALALRAAKDAVHKALTHLPSEQDA